MTTSAPSAFPLAARDALPDSLKTLVTKLPRNVWEAHHEFGPLTQFWLQRHMMFRQLLRAMSERTEARLDKRYDPRRYQAELGRLGGLFVGQLHEHHSVEDHHYFPKLVALDADLAAGFALLDADHHALDAHLADFVDKANAILQAPKPDRSAVDAFGDVLQTSHRLLDRHLIDEEDLIVPILLTHGERSVS